MQWALVFFLAIFLICTCHDNERAAEDARIEREVARRIEIERKKLAKRGTLHTVSLIGFIVLTGGVLVGFLWVRRTRFVASLIPADPTVQVNQISGLTQQSQPQWNDYQAPRSGRVIDLRTVVSSRPVLQTITQPSQPQSPVPIRRQHRRRWNRDPDRQTNPPRRYR